MTSKVVLREVRDDDLAVFFEQQMDPTANRMVAFTKRDPVDREALMAHWAKIRHDVTVTVRTVVFEQQVAGYVGKFERSGKPEVCYWIGREYWGQGMATAALSRFLTEIEDRPLYAGVAEDNLGSIRVLEKCGFAIIGLERTFAKARGEEINELVMKLK